MAHHGNTPAAWTGVVLILVGFLVAGIGLVIGVWTVFWIGVAFGPVGMVAGKVMSLRGLGAEPLPTTQTRD